MSGGAYIWVAILRDGSTVGQFEEDGTENSVDILKDKEVQAIRMYPINSTSRSFIHLEINDNEEWIKHWLRMKRGWADTQTEVQLPDIDVIGLKNPQGSVKVFIFPDGSIKITTKDNLE